MKKELAFAVFFLIFLTPLTGAEISISEPEEVYNLGDRLYIVINLIPSSNIGWFKTDLICEKGSENLEKIIGESFAVGEKHQRSIIVPLTPTYLSGLKGVCQISSSLGGDETVTKTFQISDEIFITASTDKPNYNPTEVITLTVEATKANGDLLEGFVEASNAVDFSKEIEKGFMTKVFSMNPETGGGTYSVELFVYDIDEERGILNQGTASVSFRINQIVSFIQISLDKLEVEPGENLTISVDIFDQSGKEMNGTASLLIISPTQEETQMSLASGDFASIDFPANSVPGTWSIYASFEDADEESAFEVQELQKVEFEFVGSVLIVRNVGNVVYNKPISVKIGEEEQELNLNLGVGEEEKFNLNAPDGEYDVIVGEGASSIKSSILLTGKAISIKDLDTVGIFKNYSIVWVFLIVIILGVGIIVFFKFRKTIKLRDKINSARSKVSSKVSKTLPFTNKSPESQSLDNEEHERDKKMIDLTAPKIGRAESSLVLKGEKSQSAVICLSIKNYDSLNSNSRKELAHIVSNIKNKKGLVDWKGEHIFIVFSPVVTKTFKNEILAAKAGFDILKSLQEHNKKFSDRIEFNIGINAGDLVASRENRKLKYTSIGNTIALAKKISDSDEGKLLVSDRIRKRLMRDLQAEKVGAVGTTGIYEVSQIKDRTANEAKLKDILKRMEKS